MHDIRHSIEKIRAAHNELGTAEMSRLSGVNYTTIRALAENHFRPKTVEILEKLEAAANQPDANPTAA